MSQIPGAIESGTMGGVGPGKDSDGPKLKIASEQSGRLGRYNEWFSEWCSSILVKETRQALKSRQFIWTYVVLLLCVGVWTVLGLAVNREDYNAGRELLIGFWYILGFPLGLIIPFSAYRSLAREFEDGTIQLISITTMKPYQIVIGKFGSAILQMLIYLSVLAPCILFTYMLRGISLESILLGLSISVGGSICLTIVGLFLAGAFRSRTLGIGVSVLFVLALGWLYWAWCMISYEFTFYGGGFSEFNDPRVIAVIYCFVAFFASTAALLLVAAAAQISFPSDNRSTSIRIVMMIQQMLFFAVLITMIPDVSPFMDEFFLAMIFVVGHYWLVMGFLMIGESSVLSRRVQRSLPRTFFSRSCFSLLMPGSGRGFLFAIANVWACCLGLVLIGLFSRYLISEDMIQQMSMQWGRAVPVQAMTYEIVLSSAVCCFFVTWFLSVIYLGMLYFEKRKRQWSTGVGPLVSLIAGALFVAALTIGTFILHFSFVNYDFRNDTSPILVLNWYWATVDVSQGSTFSTQIHWFAVFCLQAMVVIFLAMSFASRELLCRPIAVPERVAIDLQSKKSSLLPAGESIEEIFGDMKSSEESTQ